MAGDLELLFSKGVLVKEFNGFFNGQICDIDNGMVADLDCQDFFFEPIPAASRARRDSHELFHFPAAIIGLGLPVKPFGLGQQSFPGAQMGPVCLTVFHAHTEADFFPGTVHQYIVLLFCQVFKGCKYIEAEMFGHCSHILPPPAIHSVPVNGQGTVGNAKIFIRDNQIRVEFHLNPQASAGFTGTERTVKGKHPRLKLFKHDPALGTTHLG